MPIEMTVTIFHHGGLGIWKRMLAEDEQTKQNRLNKTRIQKSGSGTGNIAIKATSILTHTHTHTHTPVYLFLTIW